MHRKASFRENILTPHADELDKRKGTYSSAHQLYTISVFVMMLWKECVRSHHGGTKESKRRVICTNKLLVHPGCRNDKEKGKETGITVLGCKAIVDSCNVDRRLYMR